uniref:SGNH hydrolase-type esterase domain-containing protein n=1 Tax=Kryptolebias marmoratus TaxID=37003 RepID=A0A3Q3ASL6_KRYMA
MPRGKGYRQAQALKRRQMDTKSLEVELLPSCDRSGTGFRHRARRWPKSPHTGKTFKLTIPVESPDKKFVLVIGDSHLRAIVDGFVQMPDSCLSFGYLSVPGAKAAELTTEIKQRVLPRLPDVVCLLAPSNNLDCRIPEAGKDFQILLNHLLTLCPKVFVLDFPPRLSHEVSVQEHLRMMYRTVSAEMGVKYSSVAENFPLNRLELWSTDGVHLSDTDSMGIFTQLLWQTAYLYIETASKKPQVSPKRSSTARVFPKVAVIGEKPIRPQPNLFEWTTVTPGNKVKCWFLYDSQLYRPITFSVLVYNIHVITIWRW